MADKIFEIGAKGVDAAKIVAEIREIVEAKKQQGVYADSRVALADRTNLEQLRNDEQFLEFYLECLRDAVFVDISDFEITERRSRFRGCLVALKRGLWKLLKFYTYRLWSQQNQVNGLLLSATEIVEKTAKEKVAELEARIEALEARKSDP